MKSIVSYIKDFAKEYPKLRLYISFFSFLLILFIINYTYDFDRSVIESYVDVKGYFFIRFASYAIPYYGAMLLYSEAYKDWAYWRNKWYWIFSATALGVLAFSTSIYVHIRELSTHFPATAQTYVRKIAFNSERLLTTVLPLYLYYVIVDRKINSPSIAGLHVLPEKQERIYNPFSHFYGFTLKGYNWRPYVAMLAIMFIPIVLVSFGKDFQYTYPTYKPGTFEENHNVPVWLSVSIYEIIYLLDFTIVELLFRGFMVLGIGRLFGTKVIWGMVACYAALHFGKPLAEAIGSIGGGFVLGIIAYKTRSIFGGIIVHMGVAAIMDIVAYTHFFHLW